MFDIIKKSEIIRLYIEKNEWNAKSSFAIYWWPRSQRWPFSRTSQFGEKKKYVEPDEFKQFLYLLARISNNHIRSPEFINKIEQILNNFKDSISKYGFKEIFNIFKGNRRVILYFIKEKIISLEDPSFLYIISNPKYINLSYHRYLFKEYAQKTKILTNAKISVRIRHQLLKRFVLIQLIN